MKIALIALATVLITPLMAQGPYSGNKPSPQERGKNLTPEQRKKVLKKFDRDRDGKLNAEEAEAARAALQAKKAQM